MLDLIVERTQRCLGDRCVSAVDGLKETHRRDAEVAEVAQSPGEDQRTGGELELLPHVRTRWISDVDAS